MVYRRDNLYGVFGLTAIRLPASSPADNQFAMSRTFAALAGALVRGVTAPLSARQRKRTLARLIESLARESVAVIECARGPIRMHELRSAHAASTVARFFSDEPETLAWIDTFAGGVFLDVGANIGIYTLYAALNADLRVVAVEPNGINFGMLVEHLALNPCGARVAPLCIALGARTGLDTLHMHQVGVGVGGAALGPAWSAQRNTAPSFSQTIPCYTLDDLVGRLGVAAPRYIKIDVDGTEQDILRGAHATLPHVESLLMEVEHRDPHDIERTLEGPLRELGFSEDQAVRMQGSGRNRLYRNQRWSDA